MLRHLEASSPRSWSGTDIECVLLGPGRFLCDTNSEVVSEQILGIEKPKECHRYDTTV